MPIRTELLGSAGFKRSLTRMQRDVFPTANQRAINRTAAKMRTRTARGLAKHMGLKQKDVRSAMRLRKATRQQQTASLSYRGRPFNLIRFSARQLKKGVKARPWGQWRTYTGTFIATVNGTQFVAKRPTRGGKRVGRLPIEGMYGPGVAESATDPQIEAIREDVLRAEYPSELERQLVVLVDRALKKRR